MSTVNYNIDDFRMKSNFRFNIIASISAIIHPLKIKWLNTLFTRRINKDFALLLKKTRVIAEAAKKIDKETATETYPRVKATLFKFRKVVANLEKKNYYNNSTTKRLIESTLDNFYSIELSTRIIAFDDNHHNREDEKELVEFASRVSLRSLHGH